MIVSGKTFTLELPIKGSDLAVEFRQPTHEEFNLEEYGLMAVKFSEYQEKLAGPGCQTFEEDILLLTKATEAIKLMIKRVIDAMQATQVGNNNGGDLIDVRGKLMEGKDADELVAEAFEDGGAIEQWIAKVLPSEETSGN